MIVHFSKISSSTRTNLVPCKQQTHIYLIVCIKTFKKRITKHYRQNETHQNGKLFPNMKRLQLNHSKMIASNGKNAG
ncbi:hypothetical protein CBW18_05025 [Pedobacter sp. AJM]|nr:hypothetical protein CBW18_05025 [Pedobacter sp. AJM]